jgi:hypothetical protein
MRTISLLALLVLFFSNPSSYADKPGPPTTYQETSGNGSYLFVMISPEPLETEVKHWNQEASSRIRAIRTAYGKSGLYKNDGSKEPLWTIDGYLKRPVAVAGDGIHLVAFRDPVLKPGQAVGSSRPFSKEELQQEAFSLFAKGKLLRRYTVDELVDVPDKMPRSVSHFKWKLDAKFLDVQQQFEIHTHDGNRIVLELKTGNILTKEPVKSKQP